MKKILLVCFMLVSFTSGYVMAQDRTVSGKVTSASDGAPLPGVTVMVKGTTNGTTTDVDGNYKLSVPSGETVLQFSFIGMAMVEQSVGSRSVVDVAMADDLQELSEVVVVGYGTTTRQSFVGSMKEVSPELIERKSVSNVTQALAGEVAGVNVINTSGQPGTNATVRIRGIGSVNGNSAPLYVVDGVPFFGNINSINPSDIESVTVLKDATATAIYGSRGANGVILINTRKGKSGETFIEVDGKYGQNYNFLPRYSTIKSPEEYMEIGWDGLRQRGIAEGGLTPQDAALWANDNLFSGNGIDPSYNMWNSPGNELIDPATGQFRSGVQRRYDPESWEDFAFQPSERQEVSVKIGGGDRKVNYFTSVGYLKDVGYSVNSDFERVSARFNLNHQVKDWLSGGVNFGYSRAETNNGGQSNDSGSVFWFVDNIPSIYPLFLRDAEGNTINDPYYGGLVYDYGETGRGFGALTNSISDANINIRNRVTHDLNGNAHLNVSFTDDLTFESRYGWQYFNSGFNSQNSPFYGPSASTNGSISKQKTETFTFNFTNLLRYSKSFGNHSVEALAAHESNLWRQQFMSVFKNQLFDPFGVELNNAINTPSQPTSYTNDYAIESYFAQLNYSFEQKYYFTGTVRRDGSSRFVRDKWGTFGSAGVSWVLSNESFLKNNDLVKFLKLKTSYGITGDQAGVGYYPGYDLFRVSNLDGSPSLTFDTKGNPDLTWETAEMFQAGLEFNIGTFLDANVDYYVKTTNNLIFDRRVGPSLGYALLQVNDGRLRNSGLEFDIVGHILKRNDLYLDLRVNGELINNELLDMPIDPATNEQKIIDISGNYGRAVGYSLFDYYMREWAGVNPENGAPMWTVHYIDENGDGEFTPGEQIGSLTEYLADNPEMADNIRVGTTEVYQQATQKFIGKSAIPKVRGAINLSFGYKGFDFSALFLYSLGGYAYDGAYAGLMHTRQIGGNNWHVDIRDRWQESGDVTDIPRISNGFDVNTNSVSSRFLTKSNFFNLNNIKVGYTLPKSVTERIGVQLINVFVAGDNLFLLSARDGFNPSTSITGSSSTYTYNPLSTLTGGIKVRF